jgi:hypothetical protein
MTLFIASSAWLPPLRGGLRLKSIRKL